MALHRARAGGGRTADPWRDKEGFSQDIEFTNRKVLEETKSDEEISVSLREWLEDNQPCLFGRLAVGKLDLLSFCILREHDLEQSDTHRARDERTPKSDTTPKPDTKPGSRRKRRGSSQVRARSTATSDDPPS